MVLRRRRENILVAILAVLAVLGGGHAILSFFSSPPPGPSDESIAKMIGRSQLAESFARDFVVAYLGADASAQDRIAQYVSSGQQVTLPSTPRQVSDPEVVFAARETAVGELEVWTVTVSVRPGAAATASAADKTAREYYRVAVSMISGTVRALSLPAAVDAPQRGSDLALGYQVTCTADSPLGQVAAGFLTAYLTGTADVTRYAAPNSGIVSPVPPPFSSAKTTSVSADLSGCGATGTNARVLAMVDPKGAGGASPTLAYPLTMIRAGGQWQVQAVDLTPELRTPLTIVRGGGTDGTAAPSKPTTTTPSPAVSIPPATQN